MKSPTRSVLLGALLVALACGEDVVAPTPTRPDNDPLSPLPLPNDLVVATRCAINGFEDFGEVARSFIQLIEKVHDPNKTLPINLLSYSPITGSYEHYVDLDDDGIREARLSGRVRSSSNLSNGLQPGEAFGARWDIRDPVTPFTHHARGAFGNGVLSFSTVRMSLTQFVDTTEASPDSLWGEPTFAGVGTCPEFAITSLQLFVDDLDDRGSLIDSLQMFIPRGDIGFTSGELSAFLFIPEVPAGTEETRKAAGTASFRGITYDCEVDLGTFQVTMTER